MEDDEESKEAVRMERIRTPKALDEPGQVRMEPEISPFELKNQLIQLAQEHQRKSARVMLDAGRGNPNWVAAAPREAFFALGQFAMTECRLVCDEGDLAGKPRRDGMGARFEAFAATHRDTPGVALLQRIVQWGVDRCGFSAEEWLYELVDGIVGDNYPTPDRMLTRVERVMHQYLIRELCQGDESCGPFDLFATEGGTAAMCYLFDTLLANRLLRRGDRVAVGVPVFPPYVEIPQLHRYDFDVVEVRATGRDEAGRHTWQYPPEEVEKLADPSVKAFFLVNPSNPPSVAMAPETVRQVVELVREHHPNLMIITDDVYATFVDGFRSLLAELPHNTAAVYSLSKYFGVTGWRLGVIAVHRDNVFDRLLRAHPEEVRRELAARYASVTSRVEELRFVDRLVADSRQVALNHTAGLSTPQQVQMALMAVFALLDVDDTYKRQTQAICRRRMRLLYEGLGMPEPRLPLDADYYTEFDLEEWSNRHYGRAFTEYLTSRHSPVEVLYRLAERSAVVLLPGGGFHGPRWSVRVSLANLDDDAYRTIGRVLHDVLEEFVAEWRGAP
ncbi:MAG: aspartate 4-decarboxylase [Alicyclobacillus macrosporangiidus]|nr:aspartate 4-decarboxylase [Alicyclobacillus macrosporangiidus]